VYSREQLQRFSDHVRLPARYQASPVVRNPLAARTGEGLDFLAALMRYHLAAIPFENLDIHHSQDHAVSLDPQALFHKVVERNAGRGGYRMQLNTLFGAVLAGLDYDLYPAGARINPAGARGTDLAHSDAPKPDPSRYGGW
jgi:arylamine N-acetyltransferase